jgi:hypothetical protein
VPAGVCAGVGVLVGTDVWLGAGWVSLGDVRADREGLAVRDGLGDRDGAGAGGGGVEDRVTTGAEGAGPGLSTGCTDPAGSGRTST